MLTKKNIFTLIGLLAVGFLIIPVSSAQAQLLPACTVTGNCGWCDILDTAIRIFRWLLGILGGTALLLFIWHAFGWLTAGGNKEKIETTRKALTHTVIGIIIILASWFIVNLVLAILLNPTGVNSVPSLFGNKWYEYCTGNTNSYSCVGKGEGSPCGNGEFCLTRGGVFGCGLTDKTGTSFDSACHYWSSFPEYEGYGCVSNSANCVTGRILGTDYCKSGETCCLIQN